MVHFHIRAAENSFRLDDCSAAGLFAIPGKEIQELDQDIFGCDQLGFRNQFAGSDSAVMPLVSGVEESHKVERIEYVTFTAAVSAFRRGNDQD